MSPLLRKLLAHHWPLTLLLAVLVAFGIHAVAIAGENNPSPAIQQAYRLQMIWALAGGVLYFVASLVDYRWWIRVAALPGWVIGLGLLGYLLVKGEDVNDTRGWIDLGPVSIQPSQLAMGAAIMAVSACLGSLRRVHALFRQPFVALFLVGLLTGIPCLLVLLQGDVGSALVWLPVCAALCVVGNIPLRHLMLVALAALTVLPVFYFFCLNDARRARIEVWLDMLNGRPVDIRGSAYAAYYATTAVGSGGWNGFPSRAASAAQPGAEGLPGIPEAQAMNSIHSQGLIPWKTVHNDFIFAVVAERYGFRGSALLILGFCVLLGLCLAIAYRSSDLTGRLVATGVATLVLAHMFQNIGMMVLLTPITGIPLPFISYGGSFLVVMLFLMGLVQSVWVHREPEDDLQPERRPSPLRGLEATRLA